MSSKLVRFNFEILTTHKRSLTTNIEIVNVFCGSFYIFQCNWCLEMNQNNIKLCLFPLQFMIFLKHLTITSLISMVSIKPSVMSVTSTGFKVSQLMYSFKFSSGDIFWKESFMILTFIFRFRVIFIHLLPSVLIVLFNSLLARAMRNADLQRLNLALMREAPLDENVNRRHTRWIFLKLDG